MSVTDTRQESAIAKAQAWYSDIGNRRDKANNSFTLALGNITLQTDAPVALDAAITADYHFPTLDERVKELAMKHVGGGPQFVVFHAPTISTTHTLMNKIFGKNIGHDT